jgi:hypothetical protein
LLVANATQAGETRPTLAAINMKKNENKLMKSINPLLAIPVLAVLALVGCNQNTPSSSTDTSSTNSSMGDASGTTGGTTNLSAINSVPDINTNMPATNSLPDINTNTPATNSLPDINTNTPASTNQ